MGTIIHNHCYYVCIFPCSLVYVIYSYVWDITATNTGCRRFFVTLHPYEQSIEESYAIDGFQSIDDYLDDNEIIYKINTIRKNAFPGGLAVAKV